MTVKASHLVLICPPLLTDLRFKRRFFYSYKKSDSKCGTKVYSDISGVRIRWIADEYRICISEHQSSCLSLHGQLETGSGHNLSKELLLLSEPPVVLSFSALSPDKVVFTLVGKKSVRNNSPPSMTLTLPLKMETLLTFSSLLGNKMMMNLQHVWNVYFASSSCSNKLTFANQGWKTQFLRMLCL